MKKAFAIRRTHNIKVFENYTYISYLCEGKKCVTEEIDRNFRFLRHVAEYNAILMVTARLRSNITLSVRFALVTQCYDFDS